MIDSRSTDAADGGERPRATARHREKKRLGEGLRGVGRLYAELWRISSGRRRRLLSVFIALIGARLVKLSGPALLAVGVNILQQSGFRSPGDATLWAGALVLVAVVRQALWVPARSAERFLALQARVRFTEGLYDHIVELPLSWHQENHSGDVAHRLRTSSEALFSFAQSQAFYLQTLMTFAGSMVAFLIFDPWTALVAIVGYGGLFVALAGADRPLNRAMQACNQVEARLSAELTDNTGNAVTVVALGLQQHTRARLRTRLMAVFSARGQAIRLQQRRWAVVTGLAELLWCVLVIISARAAWTGSGAVAVGTVVLVAQLATEMTTAVLTGSVQWQDALTYAADFRNADPLRQARPEPPVRDQVPADWGRLVIRDLEVRFGGQRRGKGSGLHDVRLTLDRGERIALVGSSGAGKSTLLRALAGIQAVVGGDVVVDGCRSVDVRGLRSQALLIPQEPEIFAATVRHNLTLGREPDAERLDEACRMAQLNPVLADLPDGLATDLAERGLNLSGGQKQRIALARGLLAASARSLLLLDEPTSSLDPATERAVYQAILEAHPDTCVVSSVHRLHLLPWFDRVVLMDAGRILDIGSPSQLLRRQPLFRFLWAEAGGAEGAESAYLPSPAGPFA